MKYLCFMAGDQNTRFRRMRIAVLSLVLVAVAAWGLRTHLGRARRTDWRRHLEVAVVLVGDAPVGDDWRAALPSLERWIAREAARWRGGVEEPLVWFSLYGPVDAAPPPFEPPDGGWLARAEHAWRLSRALSALDTRARVARADVRIYVLLERGAVATVEGVGEEGGDAGLVRATVNPDLSLALAAVAHELFHCLGAVDKYDAAGHARADAWVEPERGYPQRFAEIMVGEVPLAPGHGRLPVSLDELRVGSATAAELRWR
jgi:hypothetical protein